MNLAHLKTARAVLLLSLSFLLTACGGSRTETAEPDSGIAVDDSLRQALATFVGNSRQGAHLALSVYDLTARKPLYEYRADSLMPPASCMKLLTGLTLLHRHGSGHAYVNTLSYSGRMAGDTLVGDIALRLSLDPLLRGDQLPAYMRQLRRLKIHRLRGRFIVELPIDTLPAPEPHWTPGDITARDYGLPYQRKEIVRRHVVAAANAQGLAIGAGDIVFGRQPAGMRCIYRFRRDMKLVLRRSWKNSNNPLTNTLLYTINHPDSAIESTEPLYRFISEQLGDTCTRYIIHDGSGLCPQNRLTARLLTSLLVYGSRHDEMNHCLQTLLPLSGVDGTLWRQMPRADMRGRIRAKTGTLSHPYGISTLAGYCQGRDGHRLAFAIMNTEMSVLDARPLQEKICRLLLGLKPAARPVAVSRPKTAKAKNKAAAQPAKPKTQRAKSIAKRPKPAAKHYKSKPQRAKSTAKQAKTTAKRTKTTTVNGKARRKR